MIILYALAGFWAIGITGGFWWIIFTDEVFDNWVARFFALCIATPIWLLLTLYPFALVHQESGPTLATLLKSEWHCTGSKMVQSTTYSLVGNVMVPITSTSDVCVKYERKS